jgi:hypothetical protein
MATYIIRAGLAGPVKIGKADDVEQRRDELQTAHHETLHVLRVIDTAFDAEKVFHERFATSRIRGEWFEFEEAMLTFVPEEPKVVVPVPVLGASLEALLAPWPTKELARRIGVTQKTIENWKRGKAKPTAKHVFTMLRDPDLDKLILTAMGRPDLVNPEETIAALKAALVSEGK